MAEVYTSSEDPGLTAVLNPCRRIERQLAEALLKDKEIDTLTSENRRLREEVTLN